MIKSQWHQRLIQCYNRFRLLHINQTSRAATTSVSTDQGTFNSPPPVKSPSQTPARPSPPLSILPFPTLLRSYALTAISSYPLLISPSLRLLSFLAHSSSALLNPDRNPILHYVLKRTFYYQYCAGETASEVKTTINGLKHMGYKGVILTYGKEMVLKKGENVNISAAPSTIQGAEEDVEEWKLGTMKTVEMTEEGDFTGLKFSGAGQDAMRQLAAGEPPSKAIEDATIEICELARLKGVGLLFDAEQDAVQRGIDSWTLDFQRRYNKDAQGKAVVYGTYQAYLRSAPETLAQHLSISQQEGFTLGVKLVRGAYMASDPRELFWAQKEDTDVAYDGITEALVKRRWNNVLKPSPDAATKEVPAVAFVLASHNNESVKKAMAMRREQTEKREEKINMVYAQLLGMADDVSCALVLNAKERSALPYKKRQSDGPKAYKYVTWGSVGECLRYLIRRAEENRDAVTRAKLTRTALRNELGRRLWGRRTGVEQ